MVSVDNAVAGGKLPVVTGVVLHVEAAVAVPVQSVLALVGGIFLAHKIGRNLKLDPNPSIIRARVLNRNDLGNGIAVVGLAGDKGLVLFKGLKTVFALLLLIQSNLDIAHGERIGRGLRIGEVRQRAADDQHRDEHDCDRSHQNGFLLHK